MDALKSFDNFKIAGFVRACQLFNFRNKKGCGTYTQYEWQKFINSSGTIDHMYAGRCFITIHAEGKTQIIKFRTMSLTMYECGRTLTD